MIVVGNDHSGVLMKNDIVDFLKMKGFEVLNVGVDTDESVDYPEIAKKVAIEVLKNKNNLGILICGTGIGMSIAANKISGIRAANCNIKEMARLAREHNNANILTVGARIIKIDEALEIVDVFTNTNFSYDDRHIKRISMLEENIND